MSRNYSLPTIKALFGEASACAFPDCGDPLVFRDRGQITIVAQIAHIRSEQKSGPRYDPDYPPDLIDEHENLLLLCGTHHPPVDRHESLYPTGELLEWKRKQVAGAGGGIEISDTEARRSLACRRKRSRPSRRSRAWPGVCPPRQIARNVA